MSDIGWARISGVLGPVESTVDDGDMPECDVGERLIS